MSLIKKNPGKVKYFIVKVIDRFSRGGSGPYQAMKDELARHGVELRDMSGVIQPKDSPDASNPKNKLVKHGFGIYLYNLTS